MIPLKKIIAVCMSFSFLLAQLTPASAVYNPSHLAPPNINDLATALNKGIDGLITLKFGPHDENWWEQSVLTELAGNPTPWGDDALVPVESEKGVIKKRITREMLQDYDAEQNPDGRFIWKSFGKMEEIGPLAIAGVRHLINYANVHDSRQVKNSFERLLTITSLGLMVKIMYNKGQSFPYQANYGHEVRVHSETMQDIAVRTLAAMGFVCHVFPDNKPTSIWNTSTVGKFFNLPLNFCDTASHAESEINGLKIMDYEGSQFLISSIEAMIAIQRAILQKIEDDGYFDFYLSAADDPRITDELYTNTNGGQYLYRKYQEKTAADPETVRIIKSMDLSKIHVDCAHGAAYRTLSAFFSEMGMDDVKNKIDWFHTEERADFGNIGKLLENPKTGAQERFDLGADVSQMYEKVMPDGSVKKYFPVLCTADFPEKFAAMPLYDIILHTDMDNDRLVVSQILPNNAATGALLDEIGVVYNVINEDKICAVFIPNKFFHMLHEMNLERLTKMMKVAEEDGGVDERRTLVVLKTLASTPAVDKWVEKRKAEGYDIVAVNTAVGFAKLANVMYRAEGFMRDHPGEDVIITDASGSDINLGTDPILIAAWEESGGIITGITGRFKDLLGKTFLAEREKSATESIFLSLALMAKLKEKAGSGEVNLAQYMKELYDRDEIDTPIDFRYDNKLFVPNASERAEQEETEGNQRKNRVFGAYLAMVIAYMKKEISLPAIKDLLKDIFQQEYEARSSFYEVDIIDPYQVLQAQLEKAGSSIEGVSEDAVITIFETGFSILNRKKREQKVMELFEYEKRKSGDTSHTIDDELTRQALIAVFNQWLTAKETNYNCQKCRFPDVMLDRFRQVDIDSLVDIKFTGDGVMFEFEKAGKKWFVLFRPSGTEPKLKAYGFGKDAERLTIDSWVFAFNENIAGELPDSFKRNRQVMAIWGADGEQAVEKARNMQAAWEDFGLVVDPNDLEDLKRVYEKLGVSRDELDGDSEAVRAKLLAGLEKRRLVRTFSPPDNHLELVNRWLKQEGLKEIKIDLSQPQAMPQESIVALLKAIPDELYAKLGSSKQDVLANEGAPPAAYYGPDTMSDVVAAYNNEQINRKDAVSRVEAAEIVAEAAELYDEERGAARALKDRPQEGSRPELVAAALGIDETDQVQKDIATIKAFFERHFGTTISSKEGKEVLAYLECSGIGGQRNLSGMLASLIKVFPNREVMLYSAYGAPFKETAEDVLKKLNKKYKKQWTPRKRLNMLLKREETVKLFILAASKSGTTPETMIGFQNQIKESNKLYCKFVYHGKGVEYAEDMISKLYDGKNLLTGGKSVRKLSGDQKMMLAIVLDRVILATGEFKTEGRVEADEGRARVGGSMFDCFAQAMTRELASEFEALEIDGISKVRVYDRLGGRTNVGGPDAFSRITMALYDGENDPIREIVDEIRSVAVHQNNVKNRSLFGKKLAAVAMAMGAEFMYIGLPSSIENRVVDAIQQLIGESIDVGALVGHAMGMKPVVNTTTVLARKSLFKNDDGKRLYLLVSDSLADEATKKAEEKIITREEAKGNRVVRIEIKDHSPQEVAKFMYQMMNFVEWYGNFMAADILANLTSEKYKGIAEYMCSKEFAEKHKIKQLKKKDIKDIDFTDPHIDTIIAAIYANNPLSRKEPRLITALRHIMKDYNVWYQPGVEWGKTASAEIAMKWNVGKTRQVTDPITGKKLKVPLRDADKMAAFYKEQAGTLRKNNGAYIVDDLVHQSVAGKYQPVEIGSEETPGIVITNRYTLKDVVKKIKDIGELKKKQAALFDTVDKKGNYKLEKRRRQHDKLTARIAKVEEDLRRIASQVDCNEKTARQLGRIAFKKHQGGQSLACSFYTSRQRFEAMGFEDIIRMLDIFDTFQYAPDKQHTDADGDVAGTKTAFQILTHVREKMRDSVERAVADGMVAPYWDGLADQDLIYINHQAYAEVYKTRKVDHIELRLEGSTMQDVAKIYVLFAQANRIYLALNNALGDAAQASLASSPRAKSDAAVTVSQ